PGFGSDIGQLPRLAAGRLDDPELVAAGAVRLEEDSLPVGAPARVAVLLAGGIGQLPRRAAVGRGQPEYRRGLVAGQVHGRDHVGDQLAVGADLRIGDALEAGQVVYGRRPLRLRPAG